ncbi:MAG: hypothetical protein KF716_25735 [Anaerolineae bacterium]|nr:hypothetical protein [Anaerolineae bacterium]
MSSLTQEKLISILEEQGREEPFYLCLFQLVPQPDPVYQVVLHLARAVIATRLWHRAAYLTHCVPDTLDEDTLRTCIATEVIVPPFGAKPPADTSVWRTFYLTPPDFAEATYALDTLLKYLLSDSRTAPQRRRF